jgi:hypothetical protein
LIRSTAFTCLCAMTAACGGSADAGQTGHERSGRFGTLRDLVLFDRPERAGGPFFLDRFEATRADFCSFTGLEGQAAGGDSDALPQTHIDLAAARQFAAWRCCRVQRADEWAYAATGGGANDFPWGKGIHPSRANTFELGIGALLPVGVFESGRLGDGPYDLVGNAAEWTESPPPSWFSSGEQAFTGDDLAFWRTRRTPALSIWFGTMPLLPPSLVVAMAGDQAPRLVVGSDFQSAMRNLRREQFPSESSEALGVRLAAAPDELLWQLGGCTDPPDATSDALIRDFLRRPAHRSVLLAAWPAVRARLVAAGMAAQPIARLLAAELGG